MTHIKSLRTIFRNQLLASIGLLILVYSLLLHHLFFLGLNNATHRSMTLEARHYAEQYAHNPSYALPSSDEFSVYIGRQQLPQKLQRLFKDIDFRNYQLARYDNRSFWTFKHPKEVYFILPYPIADHSEKLLLVYNNRPPSEIPHKQHKAPKPPHIFKLDLMTTVIVAALISIAAIFWLAGRLIQRVLNPLHQLAEMAQNIDENSPNKHFSAMQDKTEIGLVANTLHASLQRIYQFHQREKQFLQNASHELRTPIAVIASSLDIVDLRIQQGKGNVSDQMKYIREANNTMREMTEALLWLGRNDETPPMQALLDLATICKDICRDLHYLIEEREVTINLVKTGATQLQLPKALCRIVLNNIIRNAFEHTQSGHVDIDINNNTVTVTNHGETFGHEKTGPIFGRGESSGDGFGLGLHIVEQIADKQDWPLTAQYCQDQGCSITVSFR